jgi:hypothetical protein
VSDALEATERGAAMKNLVLMSREQRQIVFEDCKAHSLGLLHHLQTTVHDRAPVTRRTACGIITSAPSSARRIICR